MTFVRLKSSLRRWGNRAAGTGGAVLLAALLSACSSPVEKANRFYEKGNALLQKGELAKARIEFQNALQIKDDLVPAWYGLAQVAERQGEWERMYAMLNKVVDRDPKHLEAHLKLGRLLLAAGQLEKALAASETTLALDKGSASSLALRASVLNRLGDQPGALKFANDALAKDPDSIDALVVLATERIEAKDATKAIEYLERGLKLNEKNIALQLIKVQAFESVARLDSAEQVYRKLIALYPDTPAFRQLLAQFFLSHGRKDAAEAEFRAIIVERPDDLKSRLDFVRFVGSVRGPKAALQELEGMIAKDPANDELNFALAGLHQSMNDRKAADAVFRSIVEKSGDAPSGLKAKGLLAASQLSGGDKAGARKLVDEVLAKDQRNERAFKCNSEKGRRGNHQAQKDCLHEHSCH